MGKTFYAYPPWLRATTKTLFPSLAAGFFIFLSATGQLNSADALTTLLFISFCSVFLFLGIDERITLDDEKIMRRSAIYSAILKWSEIDDFYSSPHVLSIRSTSKSRRIKIFGGMNPYGLPYYEELGKLQREVEQRVGLGLIERWSQLQLPLVHVFSGLTWAAVAAYSVPFGVLLLYLVLFLTIEEMLLEKLLFFLLGMLVLAPFFVRDYRRNKKRLVLEHGGIRQTNGVEFFIPWQEITAVVMRETVMGYDSITIQAHNGNIFIPFSHINAGRILYLIKQRLLQPITFTTIPFVA
ncbi:MAG: hypothetical protein ACREII_03970 [Nitrospiraceae bacterium]